MKTEGKALLILGMHRSGTSYLANLVQSLGVDLGDSLLGPGQGNPRGHFEDLGMIDLHKSWLAERAGSAGRVFDDGMLTADHDLAPLTEAELAEAKEAVKKLQKDDWWGWKEPRTCLFVDAWSEILEDPYGLFIYRHPWEVLYSFWRRDHWDLILYPGQVCKSYCAYNLSVLESPLLDKCLTLNANSGFENLKETRSKVAGHLGQSDDGKLPEFAPGEFNQFPISKSAHEFFRLIFPQAAGIFDRLQEASQIPYQFVEEESGIWAKLIEYLEPYLKDAPESVRYSFSPMLDFILEPEERAELAAHRADLADEIGERLRKTLEWNEKAEEIFEVNKTLFEEKQELGNKYAEQQKFLDDQTKRFNEIWKQLSWTGNSWKEQKAFIQKLQKENERLKAELNGHTSAPDKNSDSK